MNKISGGSARLGQLMALLFFIPFIMFLSYIILTKNFNKDGLMFLIPILGISFIVIRRSFSCADIYRDHSFFLIKKLFVSRKISPKDVIEVGETLWPFTYYIIVGAKRKKILFFSNTSDLLKEITSNDINTEIENIKSKFILNEQENEN